MLRRFTIITALVAGITQVANAQTPEWSKDIAPILYNNCASCHRPSGIGPFELLTYQDASSRGSMIKSSVSTRYMPPWPPDAKFNRLAHERLLSQTDIKKIEDWVDGGTPQGDPNLAPPPPTFSSDGDLPGTPDLVSKIPTFTSTATTGDVYQCFVVPSGLVADKFISSFEAIPGNRDIVHHVIVYADTTGECAQLDANHPGPGYVSFGGVGVNEAIMLGGWVPGTQPMQMPDSFGIMIPKGADIVIQIHYPAGSVGKDDSTKVKFYFSPLPDQSIRQVRIDAVLNHQGALCTLLPPGGLSIPANQTKSYLERSDISSLVGDISLLGVAPHMHLIGKSINAYGVKGNDTLKFIDIPEWDFSWQGFYMFRKIAKIPQGTTLYSEAFFDNTTNNSSNPSNPPKNVTAGEATTDEMMLTFFIWSYYQPGDENKVIDPTTPVELSIKNTGYAAQEMFAPYPNPASGQIYVKYFLQKPTNVSIQLVDMQGRLVKEFAKDSNGKTGYTVSPYSISDVAAGTYLLQLQTSEQVMTRKVSIR